MPAQPITEATLRAAGLVRGRHGRRAAAGATARSTRAITITVSGASAAAQRGGGEGGRDRDDDGGAGRRRRASLLPPAAGEVEAQAARVTGTPHGGISAAGPSPGAARRPLPASGRWHRTRNSHGLCCRTACGKPQSRRLLQGDRTQEAHLVHPRRADRLPPRHLHPGARRGRLGDGRDAEPAAAAASSACSTCSPAARCGA